MAFNHKRADFWLPNFGFKRSLLSLLKVSLSVYHFFLKVKHIIKSLKDVIKLNRNLQ